MNENISVSEVAKRIHKDPSFVINAIQQGVFPGCVVVNESGRRNAHIPRKAFEEYMEHFNKSPSDELIIALFNKINSENKKSTHEWALYKKTNKIIANTGRKYKWKGYLRKAYLYYWLSQYF